jgi:two-component system, NtrC family, sensor kinase
MQCPRCQQDNPSHAKFCLECGTPLNRVEESPQSVASYADLERSLAESLEQQTATAEVLRVISSSPTDLTPVAQAIADSAGQLCGCAFSAVFRSDGELIHRVAARGTSREQEEALRLAWPRPPGRDTLVGRTILAGETLHFHDAASDPSYMVPAVRPAAPAGRAALAIRSWLGVPMLREGQPIGVIALSRSEVRPFSEREIALAQAFADQAVIAIENVRLFKELEKKNQDLTTSLDQQTATADILRVISSSPTDVQPVFDAIARNARELLAGHSVSVTRLIGDEVHLMAFNTVNPKGDAVLREGYPVRLDQWPLAQRIIREGTPTIVDDVEADPDDSPTKQ